MSTSTRLSLKSAASKKIDSPLAKYNSAGQLFCVLCNAQVKNEIYWTGHVNGKQHRENLIQLKGNKKQSTTTEPSTTTDDSKGVFKRPAPVDSPQHRPSKSIKLDDNTKSKLEIAEEQLKRLEEEHEKELAKQDAVGRKVQEVEQDDVDNDVEEEEEQEKVKSLPEGFFDDPKEDAKARGQKFRDPQEAEWDRFVKEIASEDLKSNEIVGKEEQASAVDRELEQIEEQMVAWQRVIELEKKAKVLGKLKLEQEHQMSNDDEFKMDVEQDNNDDDDDDDDDVDDDVEYNEEMDWRNKKR